MSLTESVPMLRAHSRQKLTEVESALRHVAERHGASVLAAYDWRRILGDRGVTAQNICVVSVYHPKLDAALLEGDARFATLLPCRISVRTEGEDTSFEAMSPRLYCQLLERPDLEEAAAELERLMQAIMDDAGHEGEVAGGAHSPDRQTGIGAVEDQVNMQRSVPQRIDQKGTKVEDLAGTGQHDSSGG